MDVNWRLIAIFAGGAFLVSVLSALIAGVTFGALILRAVLGAAVFGGLAMLIQLVVDRYLPELKEGAAGATGSRAAGSPATSGENESAEPSAGHNVDIVVEEEPEELDSIDDEADEEGGDEAFAEPAGGEELEEPAASESPDRQAFEEGGDDQESADELIEEVEEVSAEDGSDQDSTTSTRHDRATTDVTPDDIDRLPDIGGFADSFGDEEDAPAGGDAAGSNPSGGSATGSATGSDSLGANAGISAFEGERSSSSQSRSDQDPETIARAIQTVLRRE